MSRTVAFVLKGYPRLSETFIAQEILALERLGLDIRLISLRHPTDPAVHPVHREIRAPVLYLPEYLHQEPLRVLRGWWRARRNPGYRAAWRVWRRDWARDRTRNRLRRFGQALVLAGEMPPGVAHLHAHFLHTPASVTRYAALMTGLPWSVSAHAKDIWTSAPWEKREKLGDCEWLVTCTRFNAEHLRVLAPDPSRVDLAYHGLDFERFPLPPPRPPHPRPMVLSVGRAVDKKGLADLLSALARLPASLPWRFVHIGGGPLLPELKVQAADLGLAERIEWRGPQPQERVVQAYREADVFVLPCRISDDGDRDGLPNVLMEAQSQRLACLSTEISGVPELVIPGETGLLVPERDVTALARALERLLRDPDLRERLAEAGFRRVRQHFSLDAGVQHLAARFGMRSRAA
jgi:glycosyltransferase involved in cell wall biosynthesis